MIIISYYYDCRPNGLKTERMTLLLLDRAWGCAYQNETREIDLKINQFGQSERQIEA